MCRTPAPTPRQASCCRWTPRQRPLLADTPLQALAAPKAPEPLPALEPAPEAQAAGDAAAQQPQPAAPDQPAAVPADALPVNFGRAALLPFSALADLPQQAGRAGRSR